MAKQRLKKQGVPVHPKVRGAYLDNNGNWIVTLPGGQTRRLTPEQVRELNQET
jgi:hypothetical protein